MPRDAVFPLESAQTNLNLSDYRPVKISDMWNFDDWKKLSFYERFEQTIALILSGVIMVVIVISLVQLIRAVFIILFLEAFNPLDHAVFQKVFGMIMTLLIAMEFKHSIIKVALRSDSIIRVRTVILIALIALSRKFVLLEPNADPGGIAALAGASLALGIVYWLLRDLDCQSAKNVSQQRVAADR